METPTNSTTTTKELITTGVSRSGRVRKKSSKLLDFQSSDEVEKKPKRLPKTPRSGSGGVRGRFVNTSLGGGAAVRGGRRGGLFNASGGVSGDLENASSDIAADDDDADDDDDDDDDFNTSAMRFQQKRETENAFGSSAHLDAAADSDYEVDELVADLVEGVEAENANNSESKVRQSLYMSEKTNKRKMLKDGKLVTGKLERKDKGKARYTAYSLWSREFRKTSKFSKNQDLDFSNAARRLGELWANVSNKEKNAWRRKAKIQATKAKAREKTAAYTANTTNTNNSVASNTVASSSAVGGGTTFSFNRATTSRTKKLAAERQKTPPPTRSYIGRKRNNSYKSGDANAGGASHLSAAFTGANSKFPAAMPNIAAIDAAAHLKLLGESLTIIGERLKEHEGQIAVAGSLSVLLDSLLCSLGPLLCLTTLIPGMERKAPHLGDNLAATLDNIAYVMPGL